MRIGREPTRANHSIAEAIPFKDKEILKMHSISSSSSKCKREREGRGRVVYLEEESIVVQ